MKWGLTLQKNPSQDPETEATKFIIYTYLYYLYCFSYCDMSTWKRRPVYSGTTS